MSDLQAEFKALAARLPGIWAELAADPEHEHTSVIVPSFSVDQQELAKVLGASFYEERLLFALIRLRNPNARVIYISSQPIHPDIIDYYLGLLDGVPARHARERLHVLSVWDGSSRPLTQKVLERPRFVKRIRRLIGDPAKALVTQILPKSLSARIPRRGCAEARRKLRPLLSTCCRTQHGLRRPTAQSH